MKKLTNFLAIISGVALILYLYKLFTTPGPVLDSPFPQKAEKEEAEKKVEEIKEEIKELEQKTYTDEEIEKKFN